MCGLCLLAVPCRAQEPPKEISVVFDEIPKESGLKFDRIGVYPDRVDLGGEVKEAWKSVHRSVASDEWARSFRFRVEEPTFREGLAPNVEIEVVYLHEANTRVVVLADTVRGGVEVAQGWGNQKAWQTLKFKLEDAHFGARDHGQTPDKLPVDGWDLRINAWGGDFFLRSVVVRRTEPSSLASGWWNPGSGPAWMGVLQAGLGWIRH